MFGKNNCEHCGTKVNKSFDFCPKCGNSMKNFKDEDFGMFGKNDFLENEVQNSFGIRLPVGFNTLFKSLMKEMDKQFRELDREIKESEKQQNMKNKINSGGISINISSNSTDNYGRPKISIKSFGNMPVVKQQNPQRAMTAKFNPIKSKQFSEEKVKKISEFPRVEPETNVRRLSNKIIYEINMPGVNSLEDVSIKQLENSLEIKALAEKIKKVYSKLIPLNYPLRSYNLKKEKLVLELDSRE